MRKIVYQPEGYGIGDAMPFYEDGVFYYYHYKHKIGDHSQGQNWTLSSTRDFIHYTDYGELFKHGEEGEQDFIFRSGTLLKKDGVYHFFYGGDRDVECVLHAGGRDLKNLEKDAFRLPIQSGYGPTEWRDPFVGWVDELGAYILILGTRKATVSRHLDGASVYFLSQDLRHWEFKGDLWAPNQYTTHEMPDLFKIGSWWYLLVSEYSDSTQVIYRRSKKATGPWELAPDDVLDGPSYFAGRTVADEKGRRFLSGWIAGKQSPDDRAPYGGPAGQWVHQVYQKDDGSLGVSLPDPVYQAFNEKRPLIKNAVDIEDLYGRKEAVLGTVYGSPFMIEAVVEVKPGTYAFSINILENEKTGEAYEYKFFLREDRFSMTRTPNHGIVPPDHFRGMDKLWRTAALGEKKEFHLQIVYDDSFAVLYLDGYALSGRMFSKFGDSLSLAVFNGGIKVKELTVREGLKENAARG
jgi:beta-fructofuranosidase